MALAACGSDKRLSGDAYRAELKATSVRVGNAEQRAQATMQSGSVVRLQQGIRDWAEAEASAGDHLAGLKPPADADDANRALADAERAFADDLRAAVRALSGAPAVEAPAILERKMAHAPSAQKLDAALAKLQSLGYAAKPKE